LKSVPSAKLLNVYLSVLNSIAKQQTKIAKIQNHKGEEEQNKNKTLTKTKADIN
jgi:hypothetical protein